VHDDERDDHEQRDACEGEQRRGESHTAILGGQRACEDSALGAPRASNVCIYGLPRRLEPTSAARRV
jgi:hypothetical protein